MDAFTGRPDGPVYLEGHAKWRQLQRAAVAKGWRCASPAGATQQLHGSSSRSGTPQAGATAGGGAGELGREGSSRSAGSGGGGSSSGPMFMTIQEMRKKELQENGAMTYEEWKQRKEAAAAAERQQLTVGTCVVPHVAVAHACMPVMHHRSFAVAQLLMHVLWWLHRTKPHG